MTIDMPLVLQCEASEYTCNTDSQCHARAITIGDGETPIVTPSSAIPATSSTPVSAPVSVLARWATAILTKIWNVLRKERKRGQV